MFDMAPVGSAPAIVSSPVGDLPIGPLYRAGLITDVYATTYDRVLKIVRLPGDNDLLDREMDVLARLRPSDTGDLMMPSIDEIHAMQHVAFLPVPVCSTTVDADGVTLRVNVFEVAHHGWYPLSQIGADLGVLDPKDAAWIFRRLLTILGYAHSRNVIHGAVLPANVLIHPEKHGLMLIDWCSASREPSEWIAMVDPLYRDWYLRGVAHRMPPTERVDVVMAAHLLRWMCGTCLPQPLVAFTNACIVDSSHAPADAWELKETFGFLLQRLWGDPTFHPMIYPPVENRET